MRRLLVRIPDIEHWPGGEAAMPATLARILRRARVVDEPDPDGWARMLTASSRVPSPAALSRLGIDGERPPESGCWIRFDAVQWLPDLTAVWAERPLPLDFGEPKLHALVEQLVDMFAAEGLDWNPSLAGGFGLLRLDDAPDCRFLPLAEIPGRRLDEILPRGPDAGRWRRLINDSQMLFHQFRPLARTDQRGAGLWFWGAGGMPPETRPAGRLALADAAGDPVMTGLARWAGCERTDASAGPEAARGAETVLVNWPLDGADPEAALRTLDERWLAPAWRALRGGRLRGLRILGTRRCWTIGPLAAWAFWRRDGGGR